MKGVRLQSCRRHFFFWPFLSWSRSQSPNRERERRLHSSEFEDCNLSLRQRKAGRWRWTAFLEVTTPKLFSSFPHFQKDQPPLLCLTSLRLSSAPSGAGQGGCCCHPPPPPGSGQQRDRGRSTGLQRCPSPPQKKGGNAAQG